MAASKSLSVIIPAYNEAENLESAHRTVCRALAQNNISDYEIFIFDDASTDGTTEIADCLTAADLRVRVVHNAVNMNIGYNFRKGVEMATKDYLVMVAGDDEISGESLCDFFGKIGDGEIVSSYIANPDIRPLTRRILSRLFVLLVNAVFGLRMRYFNGICIHRLEILRRVPLKTNSFSYMAEILVLLLKSGYSCREFPMFLKGRSGGKSKALRPKKIIQVVIGLFGLVWRIHVKKERIEKI